MSFNDACPHFHGHLSLEETTLHLNSQNVGSFLLRKCKLDSVISYKDKDESVKHCIVSNKRDNNIVKTFQNLVSVDDVCQKILSIGMLFLEGIERAHEPVAVDTHCVVSSPLQCNICMKTLTSEAKLKTHKKTHKLCYCDRKSST